MKASPPHDSIGSLIAGRYRVLQLLGRGGMAVVYKACDERSGKEVAIKRVTARDALRHRKQASLLEREYHTLVQLAHPRVIEVYDYGVDDRGPYYTMELLDGGGLEDVGRMPWREVCAVLHDVGSSLAIVHSRGLIHRDVTLRNVRYAADGHVKLLDFGAMMSMGVAKDTVGTPPFMAPEAVQMQALDARVDLFSLGALGYRLLTGRHAYPARRFSDLRDAWRSKPQPPAASVPDLPNELNALILRLLTLDRAGRPQSAGEVISRLSALADLPQEDSAQISRAYLTTPTLVGRDAALLEVRRCMLALMRGDGGVVVVRGEAGTGRSRLLDACALEGKLLGAAVVRADAHDASSGEWGVARVLGNQLFELFPEPAQDAARLSRNVLSPLIDGLRGEELQTGTNYGNERSIVAREFRDWVFSLSKTQRMVMIVDDIDRIDDASIALLCAIAHRADRYAILLVVSAEYGAGQDLPSSLQLLHELGHCVEVKDLSLADTEALMRSVFGEVANLPLCAALIHQLSRGNPRAAMELAQHLVDTGRAHYERGAWLLPSTLDERDLPATLSASLAARLDKLSPDARELAEVLALAEQDALPVTSYPSLTSHGDAKRVFSALDELVALRVLAADAERYSFSQRGFVSVLQDRIAAAERADYHLRVVRALNMRGGDVLRRAHHLLGAKLEDDAIALLCSLDLVAAAPPLALLREALAAAERLQMPASTLHRLRVALLINAPAALAFHELHAVLPIVLEQLKRDSGLTIYEQLSEAPPELRLTQALTQTQQVYLATPERDRVHTVFDAIRELARLCGTVPGIATPSFDLDLLESLPSLEPLYPMSAALRVVTLVVEASKEWICGRTLRSRELYLDILRRIGEPDRGGLDETQHERMRLGIEYTLGFLESLSGMQAAEARAKELEKTPALRVNAWRIRAVLHLAIGDVDQARKCRRRAELLQAQERLHERYGTSTVGIEATQYAQLGDLLGVKNALDAICVNASRHKGWRPTECLARGHYALLQGDFERALQFAEDGMQILPPLRHPFHAGLATVRICALLALGRTQEADAHAREDVEFCVANDLPYPALRYFAGLAIAKAGDVALGVRMIEDQLRANEAWGLQGLAIGVGYQARARVAIMMHDAASFEHNLERCSKAYEVAHNPALTAQLGRLIEEAREAGVVPSTTIMSEVDQQLADRVESEYETIHSRIAECIDAPDRGRVALTLLLQNTLSTTGYLYVLNEERDPQLMAALPDPPTDPGLLSWVKSSATEWLEPVDVTEPATLTTQSVTNSETADADDARFERLSYIDHDGRTFQAAMLFDESTGARKLVAVFVQQVTPRERVIPPRGLCLKIAGELLTYGDARLAG
jgi:tRNA A-37 threonylcarbamoyl transferase component Bud32/tetratricopeptide (TPR) repeat protein